MPTSGDGTPVFLRDGPKCWAVLFSTRGAARAYRKAAGLTDMKRGNWMIFPSEGMAGDLQQRFAAAGGEVAGALLDPAAARMRLVDRDGAAPPPGRDVLTTWR